MSPCSEVLSTRISLTPNGKESGSLILSLASARKHYDIKYDFIIHSSSAQQTFKMFHMVALMHAKTHSFINLV